MNALSATLSVALRAVEAVWVATEYVTVAPPLPWLAEVSTIHAGTFVTRHVQPAAGVTDIAPLPPLNV